MAYGVQIFNPASGIRLDENAIVHKIYATGSVTVTRTLEAGAYTFVSVPGMDSSDRWLVATNFDDERIVLTTGGFNIKAANTGLPAALIYYTVYER